MFRILHAVLLATSLSVAVSGTAMAQETAQSGPDIWFSPQSLASPGPRAADFMDLFTPNAPWKNAASHVHVFSVSGEFMTHATQDDVNVMVADLKRRGIALGLEVGVMNVPHNPPSGCGGLDNVEGYGTVAMATKIARVVKDAGGEIGYIAMDEPFSFGHYYTNTAPGKSNGCHSSVAEILALLKPTLNVYLQAFPNVVIGDTEPTSLVDGHPAWQDDVTAWVTGFRSTMGRPLAFFDLDVQWPRPSGVQDALAVFHASEQLKSQQLIGKVGIIYNGSARDMSDAAWIKDAESNVQLMEGTYKLHPDRARLQSWNPYPTHAMPEAAPDTLTSLVDFYLNAGSR